jgi:hypothetical protein
MHRPKPPAACADLDLAQVSRVLAKHYGDIPAAARELNIPIPDLRRLTWAKPNLLEEAEIECMGVVARAVSVLIEALHSPSDRRREWAAERILSSYMARGHPFSPASRRTMVAQTNEAVNFTFRWAEPAAETVAPPISPPPELPIWAGPHPPPPLVVSKYQPWESPARR